MTKQTTNIAQFKPLLKSTGKIGMYICDTANVSEAYAGEYSVRITFNGCAINAKTTLAINSCDNLYIKAFNPLTNAETNKLIRKPNVAAKNEYEDLILQVETLDGKIIKTLNYTWDPPSGVTLGTNQNEPYKVQTNKIGRYTVQASSANGTNCPLSIDIFAEPCTIVGDAFNCNGTGGSGINAGQADLANLAVGDEFTTSDYTIVVTEASGSSTGWTGKGKLIFNFLKISNTLALQIPISVTFTGIKINQCYQLYSGTVVTEYDPSWGSIANLGLGDSDPTSELIAKMVAIQDDIVGRMDAFTGSAEDTQFLNGRIAELNKLKTDITASTIDAEVKTTLSEQVDALISYASCSADPTNTQGARVSAMQSICSLNPWVALAKCLGSASLDIFGSYAFKWLELNINGTPKSFTDFSGITSQMDWAGVLSSATVSCVFSVIPIPTGKTALAAMAGASGLAAAESFSSNILTQYSSLRNSYSSPSVILRNINWSQAVVAAGGAGAITFVSTALIRASSHVAVNALKNSIIDYANKKGADLLRTKMLSYGFHSTEIDNIFRKFGIAEIKKLPNLAFEKPFGKSNYRENLKLLTGKNPPSTTQAHHVFPQTDEFAGKWQGIDIYDPRFLQWWDFPDHQKKAGAYNAAWRAFFLANQNNKLTQSQILREGKKIMNSFGFTINY